MTNSLQNSLPQVSICIPTYNGRSHLAECINSILAQTFADFEVVICDDDSSDGTLDYTRELAQGDARFRFHANPRRFGLVGNWNNCIRQAKWEWIKFVFQDDLLHPECLERMMAAAGQGRSQFLACRRDFLFEKDTDSEARAYYASCAQSVEDFFARGVNCQPQDFARAVLDRISGNFIGEPTVTLIHRTLFEEFGMFNESLIMCCDSEYSYRVGTNVPVEFVPETLATFRVHGSSTSTENFQKRLFRMNYLDSLILIEEFITHPAYDRLRKVCALEHGQRHLFQLRRSLARAALTRLENVELSGDEAATRSRQEWEDVCSAYPNLVAAARQPTVFEKLRSRISKHLPGRVRHELVKRF